MLQGGSWIAQKTLDMETSDSTLSCPSATDRLGNAGEATLPLHSGFPLSEMEQCSVLGPLYLGSANYTPGRHISLIPLVKPDGQQQLPGRQGGEDSESLRGLSREVDCAAAVASARQGREDSGNASICHPQGQGTFCESAGQELGWGMGREVTTRAVSVGSDLPAPACTHRRAA